MVLKAQINDRITGLIDNFIPKGVAILQYTDDTIMCLKNNVEKARNVKTYYIFMSRCLDSKLTSRKVKCY
jgi:hypothetical protein